jgi:LmbE family N-acetylglucosaminyl deacetylase
MKPGPNNPSETRPLLAFGAHPDDVEFGCGAVVSLEARAGRPAHVVVCSRGESASSGTPQQRTAEAQAGAASLGATIEFAHLDGDARLEARSAHAITLAAIIRRTRPSIVLAPTPVPNQHPDHARLGSLVRDAARLARYGGIKELADAPPHAIDQLLFYAVTAEAEPRDADPILVNISDPAVIAAWTAAMEAHASQTASRGYIELQLTRSRLRGLSAGIGHAMALFPNDPIVVSSLSSIAGAARAF